MSIKISKKTSSVLFFSCVAISILLALFVPFEMAKNNSLWSRVFDAGHIPLFFLISSCIYIIPMFCRYSEKIKLSLSFLIGATLAAIVEIIQPYFGRSSELNDWVNGALGSLLATLFFLIYKKNSLLHWKVVYLLSAILLMTSSLSPAYFAWRAMQWRNSSFPLIATFENNLEILLWSSNLENGKPATAFFEPSQDFSSQGDFSLSITTLPGRYSGVIFDMGSIDARNMKTLEFDVFNASEPFKLIVRIDDDGIVTDFSQRFNKTIPVKNGLTSVLIPIKKIRKGGGTREMNLGSLRRIMFFVGKERDSKQFFIDNLRFE